MSERIPAGGAFRAASRMHESLNLEHIRDAKNLLYNYCPGEFCKEYIARISRSGLLIGKARIEDLSWDEKYVGIDNGVMRIYKKLVELYAEYISGFLATIGENIIIKIKKPTVIGDKLVIEKGETIPLPPGEAIGLILAGIAEPVREIAIKLERRDYLLG